MGRVLWASAGAVGGIYAYRRGSRAWENVRGRGVAGSAQLAAAAAAGVLTHFRASSLEPEPAAITSGTYATMPDTQGARSVSASPRTSAAPAVGGAAVASIPQGSIPVGQAGVAAVAVAGLPPGLRVGRFRISRADE